VSNASLVPCDRITTKLMLLICSKVSRDQQSRPHVYVNKEGEIVINFEAERHGRNCPQVWDTVRAEDAWFPSLREVVKRFGWVQTIANGKMVAVCQCVGVDTYRYVWRGCISCMCVTTKSLISGAEGTIVSVAVKAFSLLF
jgi:hypothetical protein